MHKALWLWLWLWLWQKNKIQIRSFRHQQVRKNKGTIALSSFKINITNVPLLFRLFTHCYLKCWFVPNTFWTKILRSSHCESKRTISYTIPHLRVHIYILKVVTSKLWWFWLPFFFVFVLPSSWTSVNERKVFYSGPNNRFEKYHRSFWPPWPLFLAEGIHKCRFHKT